MHVAVACNLYNVWQPKADRANRCCALCLRANYRDKITTAVKIPNFNPNPTPNPVLKFTL